MFLLIFLLRNKSNQIKSNLPQRIKESKIHKAKNFNMFILVKLRFFESPDTRDVTFVADFRITNVTLVLVMLV
jgi:hypothetical protein